MKKMKERIRLFEKDSAILERIASQHGRRSKEYATLARAALALWYVLTEAHERFTAYLKNGKGDLTPEQRTHLLKMGIDPDKKG